ncbi:MAG: hypothetical protein UR27_C0003G0055 [Candidatus Peregrinibacteria bacterium GW2011_GWA2_33_10]|nr:MAG: hypothetical protein UR27_C0003G0055 [Candidatus Peregrinibacteria bacterium GW2011_GWA2_33_10]
MEHYFWTFFLSMFPFTELRVAIPLAIQKFGMSPYEAYFFGVLGNIFPNLFILYALDPVSKFLMKHSKFFNVFFSKLFDKTRTKHSKKFQEYGALFLVLFIAIPLPGSGSWTGSLIAFLFGVAYWRALFLVSLGVMIAGLIITLGFTGAIKFFEWVI